MSKSSDTQRIRDENRTKQKIKMYRGVTENRTVMQNIETADP
jgi:hypothetical protein